MRILGGGLVMLAFVGLCGAARAQGVPSHGLHHGIMPPGAIGSQQMIRRGPAAGFLQPVEIRAPQGTLVSLAEGGGFGPSQGAPIRVGLLVGQVYRVAVGNVPFHQGIEVYPSIEIIDRLYTPPGQETRFPIIVEFTQEDLELALQGKFVTRVVYLEDPLSALPNRESPEGQSWFDVRPGEDPLRVADGLGRPMAIVRMGARVPDHGQGWDPVFLFGSPPLVKYPPRTSAAPVAPAQPIRPAPQASTGRNTRQ